MCIVSAVTDYYRDSWGPLGTGGKYISWDEYNEYMRLKRQAEEMDELLKQPDCYKPEVPEWEEALRKHIEEQNGPPPVTPV